jgi:hypothetical protein
VIGLGKRIRDKDVSMNEKEAHPKKPRVGQLQGESADL